MAAVCIPSGRLSAHCRAAWELGYCLHSWRLAFAHPITGRRLELEAPLPARLRTA